MSEDADIEKIIGITVTKNGDWMRKLRERLAATHPDVFDGPIVMTHPETGEPLVPNGVQAAHPPRHET